MYAVEPDAGFGGVVRSGHSAARNRFVIKLRTLGECLIEIGAQLLAPDSDALFAAVLYLCVERGRHVPRTLIAEMLWPERSRNDGRHALRQLMYRARRIGIEVEGDRENIMLPESLVAPTFSAGPSAERLVAERLAGALTIGPFLPGYAPRHSSSLAEWLDRTRAAVESRVRRVLLEVARAHRMRGEWAEVDSLSRECLRIDPLNQEATALMAESMAMIGDTRHSLAIIDQYNEEIGPGHPELTLPMTVLRRRIAERLPNRRYAGPADRCFVGRAALMQTLSMAILRARNAEGDAILLTGVAGIGKTRLVHEVAKQATLHGAQVVSVVIEEADAERPMSAFVDAVPQLRALPGAIGASPESLRFLNRLSDPAAATTPAQSAELSEPRLLAARIRQAIVEITDAVTAEGTVLVVIEDVHWLDSASWTAINSLLDRLVTQRLLLILTSRGPHPTETTPLRCAERLQVHPVDALDAVSSLSLVREIAADHGGLVSEESLRWCVEVGEGNPLYLRELSVHCLEGGSTRAIPPSLQGLLDSRIGKLPQRAKRVLQGAAILGEHANVERLDRMLGLPAHELVGAIEELVAQSLVDANTLAVSSDHALVAARVIETMPGVAKQWLHYRAALALSEGEHTAPDTDIGLACAGHWIAANEAERAIDTLSRVSTELQRIGASTAAIRLLEAALKLQPTAVRRVPLLRGLARALAFDGQWDYAYKVICEVTSLPEVPSDPNLRAADRILEFDACFRCGHDARELLDRVLTLANDRTVAPAHRIAAARRGITISANMGTNAGIDRFWKSVESLSHERSDHGSTLELQTIYEATVGSVEHSLRLAEALLNVARAEDVPQRRLAWIFTVAETQRNAGDLGRSIEMNHLLLEEALRLGSLDYRLRAAYRLAEQYIWSGQPNMSKQWAAQIDAWTVDTHQAWRNQSVLETQARIAVSERRFDDAMSIAMDCYARVVACETPLPWHLRDTIALIAEISLAGSAGPIEPWLVTELERLHLLLCRGPHHDRSVAVLALSLQRSGRLIDAKRLIDDYVTLFRRAVVPWVDPSNLFPGCKLE